MPRKQNIIVAIAVLLLLAALITAVVWAVMVEPRRSAPAARPAAFASEVRVYGGLPNAAGYGHPVIVLTNIGYLSGYCEGRRNPAWVGALELLSEGEWFK